MYRKFGKRFIDVILSTVGIILLAPVWLAVAIAIKVDDPGPVFFRQKRIARNRNGEEQFFQIYKCRSMKMSTPHDVPTHMLENPEQYITRVGKFLRRTSLDELPQIFNIWKGEMSIIGPRPALWNQVDLYEERQKYGANEERPGLTGLAQISGRDELEIPVKAKLDGEYCEQLRKSSWAGVKMDCRCFFGTIKAVLHSDGVVEGGTGAMNRIGRVYTEGKTDAQLIGNIGFGEVVQVDKSLRKKVLVTGAGSYIGGSFRSYAQENYKENFEIEELDLHGDEWKEKDFSTYDIVYHVAGIAHADVGNVSDETKAGYYAINTDLTVEVTKKAKNDGVPEFIFMSSMIVYGDSAPYGRKKVIDENTVPIPANFYGDSKLQADVAVRDLADDSFKVLVLRPPMIYGPGSKGNYQTLSKLAKKLPVFPDVENERSMLYVGNLCEFLCQVMLIRDLRQNATVLIPQNDEWTKTSNMVKEIAKASGKKIKVTKLLRPAVALGSKMPGKIGGLVNKAFGSCCYMRVISKYEPIRTSIFDFEQSIKSSEGN